MASDRDRARAEVARRGLTDRAVALIGRQAFGSMPLPMVDRTRAQLSRLFSTRPWTANDDAGLAALVGPGDGWIVTELAPGLTVRHGWRGGTFRVDVDHEAESESANSNSSPNAATSVALPTHDRHLGDTFDEPLVLGSGRTPEQMQFLTGPYAGWPARATRELPGTDSRIVELFNTFPEITNIELEPSVVTIAIDKPSRWPQVLLGIFDTVAVTFLQPRVPQPDRQLVRAESDYGGLNAQDPRDLAKLLDAITSPDAAIRRVAAARLELAETVAAQRGWVRALKDSSRPVRRAAARAMALAAAPPPRALCERALNDKDACVRYYGLRGIARLGARASMDHVVRCQADEDPRVRLAADAAAFEMPVP